MDNKDQRFPSELRHLITPNPTKRVFKQIYKLMEKGDVAAVLFMGDLTDIGNLEGYKACVNYIAGALQVGSRGKFSTLPVGIVPGNHDIDRVLAKEVGLTTKFAPLAHALVDAGLPQLPVSGPMWLELQDGTAKVLVALLNSCWGCGASEYIPLEFRAGVAAAIDEAMSGGGTERAVRAYYDRQFDTPAFSDATIQSLVEKASSDQVSGLVVACAHHNLLPQRQPRLAPYTELVNSGALRGALSEVGGAVVYLHGHIHDDPVEVLIGTNGDPLVCISAPEATAGFNEIVFVFTQGGLPLSCHIEAWRFDASGVMKKRPTQTISLIGKRRRSSDEKLLKIYSEIVGRSEIYWSKLLDIATTIYEEPAEVRLEEALELLAADGRVNIENYSRQREAWIVGAKL